MSRLVCLLVITHLTNFLQFSLLSLSGVCIQTFGAEIISFNFAIAVLITLEFVGTVTDCSLISV